MIAAGGWRPPTRRVRSLLTRANAGLCVELARATFKSADQNTFLGVAWTLITPFASLLLLYLIFRSHFGSAIAAYPLYLLVGISLFGFFNAATRRMTTLFAANRALLLNSTVPREVLVAAELSLPLFRLAVELLLCAGLSGLYGLLTPAALPPLLPVLLAFVAMTVGIGFLNALAYSFARDVDNMWTLGARLFFLATPIFYSLDSLSAAARFLVHYFNPLTPFLLSARRAFLASPANLLGDAHALLLGAALFALGYGAFLRWGDAAVEMA